MSYVTRILGTASVLLVATSMEARAQTPESAEACSLLPDRPAQLESGTGQGGLPKGLCTGLYWQRVPRSHFRDLSEFGATITIVPFATPAEAVRMTSPRPSQSGYRNVSYGDRGFEFMEKPDGLDEPTPTPEEIKDNSHHRSIEDILTFDGYSVSFSCGRFAVWAVANPSKGFATRALINELAQNLRTKGICGATTPAPVAPTSPPPPAVVDDPPSGGGGTRHFEGNTAREILAAHEFGSRYMVVLSREWDASRGCWVEERAWAGGVRASAGGDRVTVTMGPSKTFCVTGNVVSAAQVNESHRIIYSAQDNLAKALKRQDDLDPYLKDPNTRAWATNELKTVQQWIEYYKKIISATEAGLASSVP